MTDRFSFESKVTIYKTTVELFITLLKNCSTDAYIQMLTAVGEKHRKVETVEIHFLIGTSRLSTMEHITNEEITRHNSLHNRKKYMNIG